MRKRIKIRAVKNTKGFIKYTSRPTCVNWKVFEYNLAAIHENKISLTLNKAIYVGFTVLEISKWEMYNFHYNLIMNKKFKRCTLLVTDTDSLCYESDEDPREKMYKHKELFDLSNLPASSKYYCSDNKKVVGKMKDAYGEKSILKFVGLKSKMYSKLDESNNEKRTSKGHNALIVFEEFYDTLFKKKVLRHTMRGIKSKNHKLGAYENNKRSLSWFDNKRYILKNGINTLAYGHIDSITNENNKKHNEKWEMAIYSRLSVQNFDNWWFWIRQNKYIT